MRGAAEAGQPALGWLADVDALTLRCRAGIGDLAGAVDAWTGRAAGTGGARRCRAHPARLPRKAIGGGGEDGVGTCGSARGDGAGSAWTTTDDAVVRGVSSSAHGGGQ
jgi:hypothetical protein